MRLKIKFHWQKMNGCLLYSSTGKISKRQNPGQNESTPNCTFKKITEIFGHTWEVLIETTEKEKL